MSLADGDEHLCQRRKMSGYEGSGDLMDVGEMLFQGLEGYVVINVDGIESGISKSIIKHPFSQT